MNEDEMEKFEITDYDLDNEFNTQRPRRKLTKHQQTYGIWADDSDNEDDARDRKKKRAPKDYTAPIGFISAGVQNQKKKDDARKEEKNSDQSGDEAEGTSTSDSRRRFMANSSSESEDEKPSFGQSKKVRDFVLYSETTGEIAGLRKSGKAPLNPALIDRGVGNWERHTKGIGAKLLLQMGYKPGKGLGKDLQGISAPVEAHLRKGRGAIGAYGPEKPASLADKKGKIHDSGDEGDTREKQNKWKKGDKKPVKSRYYYKSVDDVIERGKQPGAIRTAEVISELSKVKVIDMTGPEQRILSGYHALSGPKKPPGGGELYEDVIHKQCANFALPELQHNLDLLVDSCEQEIVWVDREKRHVSDRMVALEQERSTLYDVVSKEKKQIDTLQNVLDIVSRIMDPSHALSLRQVAEAFKELQENYYEEYLMHDLAELAPGIVGPLITSALVSWSPLVAPDQYIEIFSQWKNILDQPNKRATLAINSSTLQPYGSLVWSTWVPIIKATITTWNPRDCQPMIRLLELWKDVIPHWILDNLLEQVILPQINTAVLQWNPLTDTTPIHVWIHPWIPLMGTRMQSTVYPIIEDKLGAALTSWHPSDRSAKLMLRPWQAAMSTGSFEAFLHKHILPKLEACLSSLVINPHQQHLDAWNWVMDWSDMFSTAAITLLLEKCFFVRWIQTLVLWLNQSPDYTQVTDWFTGWKSMLSEQLLQQTNIKGYFRKALEMINHSVKQPMKQQPGALETVSYLTNLESQPPPPPPPPSISSREMIEQASRMSVPQSFKDLVAQKCEERGIIFVPIPNRYREAKQVYRIGNAGTQCYMDRNMIFATTNGTSWVPVALNKLLEMA